MNIGIVTTWFERGASYVSRQYQELLEKKGHEVFIFARSGVEDLHFGNARHVFRAKQLPAPYPDKFDQKIFANWLQDNKIETVLFNEQKEMSPLATCAQLGIKTGAYIDYYTRETVKLFAAYDFLICNTQRHYSVFQWHPQACFLPWGTDTSLFAPKTDTFSELATPNKVTFFHSCGYSYYRKGTDLLIAAASKMKNQNFMLVLHSQKKLQESLPEIRKKELEELIQQGRCEIIDKTVAAPGLYYRGDIYVYPSRLDGLGLTMAEALSSGLALVVPDIAPMNEFGDEGCRKLVKVARTFMRPKDHYYWPMNECDVDHLSSVLDELASAPETVTQMKQNARSHAMQFLNWDDRGEALNSIFAQSKILHTEQKEEFIQKIISGVPVWKNRGLAFMFYSFSPKLYEMAYRLLKKGK